ncbi:hypothetical protein ACWEBX_22315 [Streptomyces sp. NPDC005070]
MCTTEAILFEGRVRPARPERIASSRAAAADLAEGRTGRPA